MPKSRIGALGERGCDLEGQPVSAGHMDRMAETQNPDRMTSADLVYHSLYDRITSLDLMPGDKISEAEIAATFDISRQPVRDAFRRLGNMDLVDIRPQKATKVKKFSLQTIEKARFIRLSVELEVLRRAAQKWTDAYSAKVEASLAQQVAAKEAGDTAAFHALDYDFHQIFCEAAEAGFAMAIMAENKAIVDRLCMLSLSKGTQRMGQLIQDHEQIFTAIKSGDHQQIEHSARAHLSRLDDTIAQIYEHHAQYFEG